MLDKGKFGAQKDIWVHVLELIERAGVAPYYMMDYKRQMMKTVYRIIRSFELPEDERNHLKERVAAEYSKYCDDTYHVLIKRNHPLIIKELCLAINVFTDKSDDICLALCSHPSRMFETAYVLSHNMRYRLFGNYYWQADTIVSNNNLLYYISVNGNVQEDDKKEDANSFVVCTINYIAHTKYGTKFYIEPVQNDLVKNNIKAIVSSHVKNTLYPRFLNTPRNREWSSPEIYSEFFIEDKVLSEAEFVSKLKSERFI